ncbi:zinc finger protein 22 [Anabrus simplex]|uniref:zinc finger protein 22 n=1 Tax=Anabrus simplex TaxID=316456 RepID=UPI0035A3B542
MLFKMDLEVSIKEEPICFEETLNTSCDNYKIMSEEVHLKADPKSELAEPRETQPSTDIKDEICIDEGPVGQLVACFKEEDKFAQTALLTGGDSATCKILQRQQFTHSSERSHSCVQCGEKFRFKSHLQEHVPTHIGVRPYCCDECGSRFFRKSILTQHLLSHTDERQHSCKHCGKKFHRKGNLGRHMLTHTDVRAFSCVECGRKFSNRSYLRQTFCYAYGRTSTLLRCMWNEILKQSGSLETR